MLKIVVCSDNHGDKAILNRIVAKHPDATCYIHCGDSEMMEYELSPFLSVKGNNDYYIDNIDRIIKIDNFNAYITHGHKMYLSEDNMLARARKNKCNFFIFGHTHQPFYKCIDNIHLLNPGALSYPRSAQGCTYAIIKIEDDKYDISFENI